MLQCSVARFLRELASSDTVTFPIAQQPGLQSGAMPTLLLMKDMLFQARSCVRHHAGGAAEGLCQHATDRCYRRQRPCSRCWSGGIGCADTWLARRAAGMPELPCRCMKARQRPRQQGVQPLPWPLPRQSARWAALLERDGGLSAHASQTADVQPPCMQVTLLLHLAETCLAIIFYHLWHKATDLGSPRVR